MKMSSFPMIQSNVNMFPYINPVWFFFIFLRQNLPDFFVYSTNTYLVWQIAMMGQFQEYFFSSTFIHTNVSCWWANSVLAIIMSFCMTIILINATLPIALPLGIAMRTASLDHYKINLTTCRLKLQMITFVCTCRLRDFFPFHGY